MSVAEIAPRNDDFERTPPHDVAAEQCVLGGMLLSKDAISDVIEVIRPTDHQWQTTTRAARRQQAENRTAWYWSKESRLRLRTASQAVWEEPDRYITAAEVLRTVGSEFRSLMHTAGRGVGLAPDRVPVLVAGPKRTYEWKAPAYSSRRALLSTMVLQADRPKNAATTVVHERTVTTAQIAATLRHPTDGRLNHAVSVADAVDLPPSYLPLPPYTLGVWLGDGTSRSARFTSADRRQCQACRCRYGTVQSVLRTLGVLGNKHVPAVYLRSSRNQRRALLAGLLDSDGTVTPTGAVQFSVTSRRLAEDVRELVASLGYRCGWSQKRVRGASAESSVAYTITFTTTDDVFRLERKRVIHRKRRPERTTPRTRQRFITAVRPVESVPVRCVQVDSAGPSVPGQSVHDPHPQFDAGLGLRAGRRHQARHADACSSAWKWDATRSRCGCCRPRHGCLCLRCVPAR